MYNPLRADSDLPWPISVVPGGPISPLDHVGHLAELEQLMDAVGHGQVGALCIGDRRMGKTSLLHLAEKLLRDDDVRVISVQAQTTQPDVFAERFAHALNASTWLGRERERWALDIEVGYKGIRLSRTGGHSEQPDTDDVLTLVARKAAPRRVVVIIDELVDLLSAFAADDRTHAMEFLYSLRRPRQAYGIDNLAVVLAGSVGLHHVVPSRKAVNDLRPIDVGPLDGSDSRFLARCLLLGSGVKSRRVGAIATAIAEASDGVPFYIHHIVDRLTHLDRQVNPDDIERIVDDLLTSATDPLDLRHYRDRLPDYYGDRALLAGHVLDTVALSNGPATVDDVLAGLARVQISPRPTLDDIAPVLEKLELDHYLTRNSSGNQFASDILRRAWLNMRRLQ